MLTTQKKLTMKFKIILPNLTLTRHLITLVTKMMILKRRTTILPIWLMTQIKLLETKVNKRTKISLLVTKVSRITQTNLVVIRISKTVTMTLLSKMEEVFLMLRVKIARIMPLIRWEMEMMIRVRYLILVLALIRT